MLKEGALILLGLIGFERRRHAIEQFPNDRRKERGKLTASKANEMVRNSIDRLNEAIQRKQREMSSDDGHSPDQ